MTDTFAVAMKQHCSPDGYHVRCVSSEQEFLDLADEWNRLVHESTTRSVFLTHEWHHAAWLWAKESAAQLHILCLYDSAGRLVGIFPGIRRRRHIHRVPVRALEFLAVPDNQSCDVIVDPQRILSACEALAGHLHSNRKSWDALILRYVTERSHTYEALIPLLRKARYFAQISRDTVNPYVPLQGSWEDYYKRRSRRLKKGNNLIANHLNKTAQSVEIRHITNQTEDDLSATLSALIQISSQSWKSTTGLSLDNPGPSAFIRQITRHANIRGWLSVWLLLLDNRPVAAEYHLRYNRDIHALRADFLDDQASLSPGAYLHWKIVESLFSGDFNRYWLGPGDNPYKSRWSEGAENIYRVVIYGGTLRGRMLGSLQAARASLRPAADGPALALNTRRSTE